MALIVNGVSQATVTPSAGSVNSAAIIDGAVAFADLATLATDKVMGRATTGTGPVEALPFKDVAQAVGNADTEAQARTALGLGTLATQSGTFSGTSSGINTGDQTLTSLGVTAAAQTILGDTTVAAILATIGGQPRTGLVATIPITGGSSTGDETLAVVGRCRFDPADYAIAGLTTALTLELDGDVSDGTCTATLHNVTDASDDADVSITETDPTRKTDTVATPAAAKIYELRAQLSVGASPDYWTIGGAVLRVTRS